MSILTRTPTRDQVEILVRSILAASTSAARAANGNGRATAAGVLARTWS